MMARAERLHNVWRIQNPDLARRIDEQKPLLLVEQAIFCVWLEGKGSDPNRPSEWPKATEIVSWIQNSYQLPEKFARRVVFQKLCDSPPWLFYRAEDNHPSLPPERDDILGCVELSLSDALTGFFVASRLRSEALLAAIAILEEHHTDLSELEADAIETLRPLFDIAEGRTP